MKNKIPKLILNLFKKYGVYYDCCDICNVKCCGGVTVFNINGTEYTVDNTGEEPILVAVEEERVPLALGLKLTYTTGNLPANNLAQWNTFFDLPTNGTAFTSLSVSGDTVTLFGGSGITFKQSLFRSSTTIQKIEDLSSSVVAVGGAKHLGAISLCSALTTVSLPACTSVGFEGLFSNPLLSSLSVPLVSSTGEKAFKDCPGVSVFNMPNLVTAGVEAFGANAATSYVLTGLVTVGQECWKGCTAGTTINLPLATSIGKGAFRDWTTVQTVLMPSALTLGILTTNNNLFTGCTSIAAVTVPTALATNNGGNPDGDILDAISLGATITYV